MTASATREDERRARLCPGCQRLQHPAATRCPACGTVYATGDGGWADLSPPRPAPRPPASNATVRTASPGPAARPSASFNALGLVIALGGALMGVGVFLPWVTVAGELLRSSLTGADFGGMLMLAPLGVALATAVLGLVLVGSLDRWLAWAVAFLGGTGMVVAYWIHQEMDNRMWVLSEGTTGTIGIGPLVIGAGGLVAVVGAVATLSRPTGSTSG